MFACAMLLSAAIWANPVTLANNTCGTITCYLEVHSGTHYAYGFRDVPPNTTVSYSSAVDFVNDPYVYGLSNGIPAADLPMGLFEAIRFFDTDTHSGFIIFPNQSVAAATLPCSMAQYNAVWGGSTLIFY